MGKGTSYSRSSSIDSSNYPPLSFSSPEASSSSRYPSNDNYIDQTTRALNTDLRLGLCNPPANQDVSSSKHRKQRMDWPPIKPHLRSTLTKKTGDSRQHTSLFVKVYMEGIPIGRKLDLLSHVGYHGLIASLTYMFKTTILCPDAERINSDKFYVLTYEDKEGDWMMVGDVPWEYVHMNSMSFKVIPNKREKTKDHKG